MPETAKPNVRSRFNWKYVTNDANTLIVIVVLVFNILVFAVPSAFVMWNWARIPEENRWIVTWCVAGYICTGFGFGCCYLCCCQFCTRLKLQDKFPFVAFKKRGPMIQEETTRDAEKGTLVEERRAVL